jgi:hypothetical protein
MVMLGTRYSPRDSREVVMAVDLDALIASDE